jgi:hypothetical protein
MRDLVKSLWRGDVRLVVTYWLYGVVGSLLLSIPLIVLDEIEPAISPQLAVLVLAYGVVWIAYHFLIIVAIWRSATKYKGSVWWAGLAKFAAVLLALRIIFESFKAFGLR